MSTTKKVFRSGPYAELIAQAVQVGDILYLSGQVGMREDHSVSDDIVAQVKQTYSNIADVLKEFDASMSDIVDETFLVTSVEETMANLEPIFTAREQAYGEKPEVTQTLIEVSALLLPELKLEIKCIAHL